MDNSKRTVHSSGALGMLLKRAQVAKVEDAPTETTALPHTGGSYFKTASGIEFAEDELTYVNPAECEPWLYANRHAEELGDIEGLIESIKTSKQLQPALIRHHPTPHDGIKYEVIFGRRRWQACLKLGIPFLVIRKEISNTQDAIAYQDAENKLRKDVSNYSNAKLYQKLLSDGVFKSERELADKLHLSSSTFNDLMAYSKIPDEIVASIPKVHELSKQMAVKLVQLLNQSKANHQKIKVIAPQLGQSITSPAKLEQALNKPSEKPSKTAMTAAKTYLGKSGKKLFTLKSERGMPAIILNKAVAEQIDLDQVCKKLCQYLDGSD